MLFAPSVGESERSSLERYVLLIIAVSQLVIAILVHAGKGSKSSGGQYPPGHPKRL